MTSGVQVTVDNDTAEALAVIAATVQVTETDALRQAIHADLARITAPEPVTNTTMIVGGFDVAVLTVPGGTPILYLSGAGVTVSVHTVETAPTAADLAEVDRLVSTVLAWRAELHRLT